MEKHQDMKNTKQLPFNSSLTRGTIWVSTAKAKTGGKEDSQNCLLQSKQFMAMSQK